MPLVTLLLAVLQQSPAPPEPAAQEEPAHAHADEPESRVPS